MTRTSALETLSRLGPVSKLFWKIDSDARDERLAFYVRDDQIAVFLYSIANGLPNGVINVDRFTATDIIAADAAVDLEPRDPLLLSLGEANNRTYKLLKTFQFGGKIHLLLEQAAGRNDAIVVAEIINNDGDDKAMLTARVEPQRIFEPVKIAS